MHYLKKVYQLIQRGGAKEFSRRLQAKLQYRPLKRQREYQKFLRATRPTEQELAKQRQTEFKSLPCFGVMIPLYNTKLEYLQALLDSFKAQTYPHFKLFMVDASPAQHGKISLTDFMQAEAKNDARIVYRILAKNAGIASNTNRAIDLAMQDPEVTHIALCDHDDFIEPNTFFEYAKVLNQDHEVKIIYSDEDVVRFKDDPEAAYVMKPDFDPFLLESCNYINHFFACEKQFLEKIKTKDGLYEQPEYDGAQDYDLYLRLTEAVLENEHPSEDVTRTSSIVYHLPKVLYHWRAAENSTASDPHNKLYAYDAARRALEAYLERRGIKGATVEHAEAIGTYRTQYHLETEPLISVIIPSLANPNNLDRVISSIQNGTYRNLEFVITNGCSGVEDAHGDILLFLSDHLELLAPDSLSEMFAILTRDGVGAVGAELLFPNGKLQHAGLVVGMNANAGHIFYRMDPKFTYGNRASCVTGYSAVSSACLMVKRADYGQVGGFDEQLSPSLREIDLCLRLRALGKAIVYTPHAKFRYHDKKRVISPSRKEIEQLKQKWPAIEQSGDPYFSHNFSLRRSDCRLKAV